MDADKIEQRGDKGRLHDEKGGPKSGNDSGDDHAIPSVIGFMNSPLREEDRVWLTAATQQL